MTASRCSCPTTRVASSAAFQPDRPSLPASRSSRHRRSDAAQNRGSLWPRHRRRHQRDVMTRVSGRGSRPPGSRSPRPVGEAPVDQRGEAAPRCPAWPTAGRPPRPRAARHRCHRTRRSASPPPPAGGRLARRRAHGSPALAQPPSRLLVGPDGAPEPDERGDQAHTDHPIIGGEAAVEGGPHVGHHAAQLGEHRVVVDDPLVGVASFAELSQPAGHARPGGRAVGRLGGECSTAKAEGSRGAGSCPRGRGRRASGRRRS